MHHLSLRNYSGCNNACFLISVAAFVHIVCSCYRIGHNGSLVAGRLFEMHQGVAIGLRLLVFETVRTILSSPNFAFPLLKRLQV